MPFLFSLWCINSVLLVNGGSVYPVAIYYILKFMPVIGINSSYCANFNALYFFNKRYFLVNTNDKYIDMENITPDEWYYFR